MDVWAFGAVLFEMLTAERLFSGETASEILAAVILKEPDLSRLPARTPAPLRRLIARCPDKDPKRRLRDIGEARILLSERMDRSEAPARDGAAGPAPGSRALVWIAAGLAAALVVAVAMLLQARRPVARPVERYDLQMPVKTALDLASRPAVAVSPDGSTVVFTATNEGTSRLYVRRRGDDVARSMPGTEGASNPAFSPDGRSIAFFSGNKLRRTTLDGTYSILVQGVINDARGVSWLDDNTVVFAPEAIGTLHVVSVNGGDDRTVTTLDPAREERSHRWPEALPGGQAILFTVGLVSSPDNYDRADIDAVLPATGERRQILKGASMVHYLHPGYLIFARTGALYAVRFDPDRLEVSGSPALVVPGVSGDSPTGAAHFSCARDGTLVYVPGSREGALRRLVWADRSGRFKPIELPPAIYNDVRISPDGTRAALIVGNSGSGEVWIHHFERKTFTRLTFNGTNATPAWSADSTGVYSASIDAAGRVTTVKLIPADGSREPVEVASVKTRGYLGFAGGTVAGSSIILAFGNLGNAGKADVVRLPLEMDATPVPVAATEFDEYAPAVSPDGRWVAYQSDATERDEIYVRDATGSGGGLWQVSTEGGGGAGLVVRRPRAVLPQRDPLHGGAGGNPREVSGGSAADAVQRRLPDAVGHRHQLRRRSEG